VGGLTDSASRLSDRFRRVIDGRIGRAGGIDPLQARARRRRTTLFATLCAGTLTLIVAGAAIALIANADSLERARAAERGRLALGLLAALGTPAPALSPAGVASGFSAADRSTLDGALASGVRSGEISSLTIWSPAHRLVYSSARGPRTAGAATLTPVKAALAGATVVRADPRAFDRTTGADTGTFDAYLPLRGIGGRIYAAARVALPIRTVSAAAVTERRVILIAAALALVVVWLLLLPAIVAFARAQAGVWAPGRRRALHDIERALGNGEFELLYQPQIDPAHGGLHAVEALVRWRHDGRLLAPDAFLPIVESSPVMAHLTDQVVELALRQLGAWRRLGQAPRMSINLSANDLSDDRLPGRFAGALERHGVPGRQLTVEVTETAILSDPARARRALEELNELGIEVAVDDFGTGHASIARLRQLPVAEVKIDRAFVGPGDERTRAYLAAMVRFCQALGLRTVAEGAEDAATLMFLRSLGCDLVQGFHLSRPLPADEIPLWRSRGALLRSADGRGAGPRADGGPAIAAAAAPSEPGLAR